MTAAPASGPYGTAVSLTAGVSPGGTPATNASGGVVLPTGTVSFFDGTTALSTAPAALTPGAGFTTSSFGAVFGSLDPAFIDVTGQQSADVNGDGLQDLLVYFNIQTGTVGQAYVEVQIFLAKAGGGYSTVAAQKLVVPVPPPANTPTVFVPVLADLNGDGKPDLLIGPSVAYGNGDGTFQQPTIIPSLATGFTNTFVADVNGDGKVDIIAMNVPQNLSSTAVVPLQITVFLNQGSGTFQSSETYTLTTGQCPCLFQPYLSLTFADLNGDGLPDIVAQSLYIEPDPTAPVYQTLTSLLNTGSGTFAPGVPVAFTPQDTTDPDGGALLTMQIADFNGDGKLDIALVYPHNNLISGDTVAIVFLPGNQDGTFGAQTDSNLVFPATAQNSFPAVPAGSAIVTDANLDGFPDLVFGSAAVALGDGTGSFSAGTQITSQAGGAFPESLGLMQLSGSPLASLVFAGNPAGAGAASASYVATHILSSTASLAPQTLAAGTHSITAKYSGDSNYAASTSAPATVNIAQVVTTTALTSSSNPAYRGEMATIAIAVSSPGSIPAGTVALSYVAGPMSGLSGPSTVTLDAKGNATFQLANTGSLAGGVGITAVYSGDANHASSTAQLTQVFDEPVTISPSTGTITVKSGQSASVQLSLTGYAGYTGPATFTCNGLPTDASCVFNPTPINVTGATVQTVTLTVSTGSKTSASVKPLLGRELQTLACGLFAGSLFLLWPRRRWTHWIGIVVIGIGLIPLGCGSSSSTGGNSSSTPPGTYPFTVVGPNAGQEEGAQFTLVVQ